MRRPSRKKYDELLAEYRAAVAAREDIEGELRRLGTALALTDATLCRACGMPAVREAPHDGEHGEQLARRFCANRHRWSVIVGEPVKPTRARAATPSAGMPSVQAPAPAGPAPHLNGAAKVRT